MKTFTFLGLGIINLLFYSTIEFSFNPYYLANCECFVEIHYQDFYRFLNLGTYIFFLLFCTLLLTKEKELKDLQSTSNYSLIDPTHYTIYQLPLVELFSKISFIACLGLLTLAVFYPTYDINKDCIASFSCLIDTSSTDYYPIWYGFSALYFTFFSVLVHRNISDYKTKQASF